LVSALRQLVDYYEDNQIPANLQKDLHLTINQYNNFQKLQHFGVVKRILEGYLPTRKGIDFIYGNLSILNSVASLNNETLLPTHRYWDTAKRQPSYVYVHEICRTSYKQRKEYQSEKSLQSTIYD
jgi:hypothetical protein